MKYAKLAHHDMWAIVDYPKVAREVLAPLGPRLVEACGIGPRQRVLDVAAGSGLASIPAAEAGASVVASDLVPQALDDGRREADARGVTLEWVEADAEDLPFADGEFDVVMSSIGAMFAPDHDAVAGELTRVCAPGGTIGMLNWTPHGAIGAFFGVFAPYLPSPPPDARPPTPWGVEDYVRQMLGDRVDAFSTQREVLVLDHVDTPAEFCRYYKAYFGPTIATYAGLGTDAERAALDRDFLDFATAWNLGFPESGTQGTRARYEYEYLVAVARRAGTTSHRER